MLADVRVLLGRMQQRVVDLRNPASSAAEAAVALEGLHLLIDSACELAAADPGEIGRLDAGRELEATLPLLRSSLSEQVRLVADPAPVGRFLVRGTAVALRRVVLELAANAQSAMPNGGRLRLGLRRHRGGAVACIEPAPLSGGRYARLFVEDTGDGIETGLLRRIFEPDFTTRGRGRGRGLAIVTEILQGLGGGISVASARGRGSRFDVFLPLAST
ncbi:MAG: hypothetical protein KDE27_29885 [Planctomycetes bacterium]|nr:hypothetical protein [Planctomycetota bacterium]